MLPDYHLHTALCKHAHGDVGAFADAARARNVPEICFTDHAPNPHGYDPMHRMELAQFPKYLSMINALQDDPELPVLLGIEADYYAGCEEFLREWLPRQGFDLVLGSIHYIGEWGFDNPSELPAWDSVDVNGVWKAYFGLVEKLVDSGLFDAVGHLDLPKKFGHRPPDKVLIELAKPVLDRMARAGMGLEVNVSGLRKPVGEIYPSPLLLSMAADRGIVICFGSDAHRPEEVGESFDIALSEALESGHTEYFRIRKRVKELHPLPASPRGRSA